MQQIDLEMTKLLQRVHNTGQALNGTANAHYASWVQEDSSAAPRFAAQLNI